MFGKKGECYKCGNPISSNSYGMCPSCAEKYYKQRDEVFPFIVRFGSNHEEFKTEEEAQKFVDELHLAEVERK